jgi:uncharacterized protein
VVLALAIMGAGASVDYAAEAAKPADAGDCAGKDAAVAEVARIRKLLAAQVTVAVATPVEVVATATIVAQGDAIKVTSAEQLRKAAERGDAVTVAGHIQAGGAGLDDANADEETALHLSAAKGHDAVVKLLIAGGANLDIKDEYGMTALRLSAGAPKKTIGNGHVACVQLLCKAGASANVVCDYGWTPLMKACEMGHKDICQILLESSDVNVTAEEKGGETALDKAKDCDGAEDIVALLLANGA